MSERKRRREPKPSRITDMKITVDGDITPDDAAAAERKLQSLQKYTDHQLLGARLVLRRGPGRSKEPYRADARLLFPGQLLVAHASGASPRQAVDRAVDRLRRQLRSIVGARVAQRNEPSTARP
jgi:ribosome-associated translation inhibitor RaiA